MLNPTGKPTKEERLLAALAHGSILLAGYGFFVAFLIWLMQRGKSRYASYHALQALGWQLLQGLYMALAALVYLILVLGGLAIFGIRGGQISQSTEFSVFMVISMVLLVFLILATVLVGVYGAIRCGMAAPFAYPWLGGRLEGYLFTEHGWDEEHEDRYAAGMAHLGLMIPLWGMAVPLGLFISQRARSALLAYQSLQALIYQAAGQLVYALVSIGWVFGANLGGFTLMMLLNSDMPTTEGWRWLVIAPFACFGLLFVIASLLWPIYQTLPLIASYRLVKGRTYDYPVVGRWVRRAKKSTPGVAEGED